MKSTNRTRPIKRDRERGEGNAKLIISLLVLAYALFCGITDVPVWMKIENLKHEMDEVARTYAAQNSTPERMAPAIDQLSRKFEIPKNQFKASRTGDTITLTVNHTERLNFLFTQYDWQINHVSKGRSL